MRSLIAASGAGPSPATARNLFAGQGPCLPAGSAGCRGALIVAAAVGVGVEPEIAEMRLDTIVEQPHLVHVGDDLLMHVAAEELAEHRLLGAFGDLLPIALDP